MSNSDTGINAVLRDIGRTPDMFRRDTVLLFETLDCIAEMRKRLEREISESSKEGNDDE